MIERATGIAATPPPPRQASLALDTSGDVPAQITDRVIMRHGSQEAPREPGEAEDVLVREEPLVVWFRDRKLVTLMRTPGHDVELAVGFLFVSGLIETADGLDLAETSEGVVIRKGADSLTDIPDFQQHFMLNSAGGWAPTPEADHAGGAQSSSAAAESSSPAVVPPTNLDTSAMVDAQVVMGLVDQLFAAQSLFHRTGAVHGSALFTTNGTMSVVREDVGRHNAADKVLGWSLMHGGIDPANTVMQMSSRASFDLVRKASRAGIRVFCAVSAPSAAAVDMARRSGITLVGFSRGTRFNVYSHPERIRGL